MGKENRHSFFSLLLFPSNKIFKPQAWIQKHYGEINSYQDNHPVCSLDSNSKCKLTKKTDPASLLPIFTSSKNFKSKAEIQRHFSFIVSSQHNHQVCSWDSNSKHNWTKNFNFKQTQLLDLLITSIYFLPKKISNSKAVCRDISVKSFLTLRTIEYVH